MRPARILVLRGGALGDFIVTLPALAALRARWPDAHLELIAYPHYAGLALASGMVSNVRSIHDGTLARYFAPDAPIRDEDQAYFASFDFIINYLHDPECHLADNLKRCSVKVLIGASPLVDSGHAVDHFLKPLESLAIYDGPRMPVLNSTPVTPDQNPWVAIHPGSGGRKKNWPLAHFLEIASRLRGTGFDVVFFTGDAERAYIASLDDQLRDHRRHHNLDLAELATRLSRARAYLGNDSGISHLAAASGCPTLALFGPSEPDAWAPRGNRVEIIRAPGHDLQNLSVDAVWERFKAMPLLKKTPV